MQFQGYATSTLPVGSLRACGGERLAALQHSSAAHGVQPPVSSRSVPMHQLILPQLMGLLAISKLRDKHSTHGESEGMGRGVPPGALTLVGGTFSHFHAVRRGVDAAHASRQKIVFLRNCVRECMCYLPSKNGNSVIFISHTHAQRTVSVVSV